LVPLSYNFNTREQQSASHNNDLLVPKSGGLVPPNPYVPSRSTNLIGRQHPQTTQSSSTAAAGVYDTTSVYNIPDDVRELITDFPNPVDGSSPRGFNATAMLLARVGLEFQPKYEEIEIRFETLFSSLNSIEDVNLQDQKRKTLMFQFDHELEKEKSRVEAELRRKSLRNRS
jgi:hypothetical protein